MIPGIDTGIGLTEERPAPRPSQSGGPGFSQALHKAEGHTRQARQRSVDEAGSRHDPRARDQYGEARESRKADDARTARDARDARRSDKAREARDAREGRETESGRGVPEQRDGSEPKPIAEAPESHQEAKQAKQAKADLQAAAQQAGGTPLQPAQVQAEGLSAAVDDATAAALAMQPSEAGQGEPSFGVPDDATPIAAQIGTAAYRMGAHGQAEAELAEAQGLVLQGSTQAQMLGKGVQDVKQATLQQTEPAEFAVTVGGQAVADETDVLQESKHAKQKGPDTLSYKEQIALQTAQARNEVLSRLAPGGGEQGAQVGADGSSAGDALRRQMQLHGLLARDARSHALDPTQPAGQPATAGVAGIPAATNSVDLTQVFETPQDNAVQSRVLERVANEARWLLNNDRQEVTFRLHPDHLGALHMKVHHKDGIFRVEMLVDNHAAKHLLESNLQDLRSRLAGDHPGGEFMFNVDVRQGNEQPSLYARNQPHVPSGGAAAAVEGLEQAPAPGMAGRVLGQGGLSIYV